MMKTVLLTSSAMALLDSVTAVQAQSTVQGPVQAPPAQNTTHPIAPAGTMAPNTVAPAPTARGAIAPTRAASATPIVQAAPAAPERISTSVPMTLLERSKVATILASERGNATAVAFPLTAGTAVPNSVRLSAAPAEVGAAVRAFAGKSFFVTPDAVVIVNPGSREIISAFSFPDRETALVPAASRETMALLPEQREMIRREVAPGSSTGPAPLTRPRVAVAGDTVPTNVTLQAFPSSVSDRLPQVKDYSYYQLGHEVVIVDPSKRRVLEVIE